MKTALFRCLTIPTASSCRRAALACLLGALPLAGCESPNGPGGQPGAGLANALQSLQPTYTVRGRVRLSSGQTLTCFNGIPSGYIGAPGMTSPAESSVDPRTGKLGVRTAAIPAIVTTDKGTVIQNECDKLAAEGVLVPPSGAAASGGAATAGARPVDSVAFASTELIGFFERHPQPGGGRTVAWPRVAITLIEAPSWAGEKPSQLNNFRPPAFGCWRFKARIWESEKRSRDIPAFHRCTDDALTIPGGDNHAYYEVWSGTVGPKEKTGSTGATRTDGPNFPDNPLPVARRASVAVLNPVTFTGQTIEGILYATRIDMTKPDPRLWLNLGPQVEGR